MVVAAAKVVVVVVVIVVVVVVVVAVAREVVVVIVVVVVVVVAREVLVVEEVVEAGLRVGRLVVGGGSSACGAPAGEHAAIKTAATAKANAKRFTANSFPEDTLTTIVIVERIWLMCVPSLSKLIIVCPVTALLNAGVGGCWGDVADVQTLVVQAGHPAVCFYH